MAITPNTQIRLLKLPFEIDNKNQLTFTNVQAQSQYFESLQAYEIERCQYQRKDNIIYFPAHIDSIINYNYVMYKNNNYKNKWFYAFITNMEYNNDGVTNITIKTDVFQTWQFDINYKRMFVEREHVSDDTIGIHTIDENLNIGEVIEEQGELIFNPEDSQDPTADNKRYYFILMSTYNPYDTKNFEGVQKITGNLFNSYVFVFETYSTSINYLKTFLKKINADGKIESIQDFFIAPKLLIDEIGLTHYSGTYDGATYEFDILTPSQVTGSNTAIELPYTITKNTNFSDYTPKNNKCFVYPYNYALISNNIGTQNIFKYEDFGDNEYMRFAVQCAFAIGVSCRLVPRSYKAVNYNFDESIALAKYPTCAWASDAYTNWLTQNAVNLGASVALGIGNLALGIATGGASLGATGLSTAGTIANLIGQFYEASLLPSIQGGQATGDVNYSSNSNNFYVHKMRVKTEYLKVIDDYFSMYGYKVNEVKIPNITGRTNWNYVKTIEANITGDIPQDDIQELKDMLNNGVTFWHNANTFLDYSQINSII